MKKIVPDPPRFTPDCATLDRTLRHYLHPASPPSFAVHHDLSFEDALAQLCDLLRCAAVTAASTTEGLTGDHRHMAASTEHLIEMAKTLADRALDCLNIA